MGSRGTMATRKAEQVAGQLCGDEPPSFERDITIHTLFDIYKREMNGFPTNRTQEMHLGRWGKLVNTSGRTSEQVACLLLRVNLCVSESVLMGSPWIRSAF